MLKSHSFFFSFFSFQNKNTVETHWRRIADFLLIFKILSQLASCVLKKAEQVMQMSSDFVGVLWSSSSLCFRGPEGWQGIFFFGFLSLLWPFVVSERKKEVITIGSGKFLRGWPVLISSAKGHEFVERKWHLFHFLANQGAAVALLSVP